MTKIAPPYGLNGLVSAIEKICSESEIYRRCGIAPNHFLINLDPGNGQTTVANYVADVFKANGIRRFGGLDMVLEYRLDGTMEQMKRVFSDIDSNAVYTNDFEGVIAIDINELASHLNETQVTFFLKNLPRIGAHSTLILFISSKSNSNRNALAKKVCETLSDIEIIYVTPYEEKDLVEITKKMIEDAGVSMKKNAALDAVIAGALRKAGVTTVCEAAKVAKSLIKKADFSMFRPRLTATLISNSMTTNKEK